jgi:hypothetical protein
MARGGCREIRSLAAFFGKGIHFQPSKTLANGKLCNSRLALMSFYFLVRLHAKIITLVFKYSMKSFLKMKIFEDKHLEQNIRANRHTFRVIGAVVT